VTSSRLPRLAAGLRALSAALSLAALLLLSLLPARPVSADLTPDDRARLTKDLQAISKAWDQTSIDEANSILIKQQYSAADWEQFFEGYFAANTFTDWLLYYLMYPVFGWFDDAVHQRLQRGLFPVLTRRISALMATHASDLGGDLAASETLQFDLFSSHKFLRLFATDPYKNGTYRPDALYDFYKAHVLAYPQFFSHTTTLDRATQGWVGGLQVQVVGNFRAARTPAPRGEIAAALGLAGRHLDLWTEFGVLVLDNNGLDARQMEVIYRYDSQIPAGIAVPPILTVLDLLGMPFSHWQWLWWDGANIGPWKVDEGSGDPFPDDAAPRTVSSFLEVLAHESTHAVAWDIEQHGLDLRARCNALLQAAGRDRMNYLRSMFEDGAFLAAPQEFLASIGNQWFCDSQNVVELGLTRFAGGRREPLNQALLFAEIYSLGGDHTWFYTGDAQASFLAARIPVTRDANGHINSLYLRPWLYRFDLDAEGNVLAFRKEAVIPAAPTDLKAELVGTSTAHLTWSDNSTEETGFEIERKRGTGSFALRARVGGNATSWDDQELDLNSTYTYRVRATNAGATSGYTNEAKTTTPPPIPEGPDRLTASVRSQTEIRLDWPDLTDVEEGYRVERKQANGSFEVIAELPADTESCPDTGLVPNTTYTYRVQAYNRTGSSSYSPEATVTTLPNAPAAPDGLTATGTSPAEITLTWNDRSSSETGFKIERKKSDGTFAEIGSVAADVTRHVDKALKSKSTYTYRVRAYNTGGSSPYSAEKSGTTLPDLPAAPTELGIRVISQTQLDLAWTDRSGNETGFELERSTDRGATYTPVATTGANTTSYSDKGRAANTTYVYRVRAVNGDGVSEWADPKSETTLPNLPAAPSELKALLMGDSEIELTWEHSGADVDGFRLERKSAASGSYALLFSPTAAGRSYTDIALSPDTQYTYRIKAYNRAGESAPSSEAGSTTPGKLGGVLSVSPGRVNFGKVKMGTRRLALVTLTNSSSTERLSVSVGKLKAPFSLQKAVAPAVLAPGDKLTLRLLFTPRKKGKVTRSLSISSSDPRRPKASVALTGTGT
jgi:fibronectin type 3 domain-containing protein